MEHAVIFKNKQLISVTAGFDDEKGTNEKYFDLEREMVCADTKEAVLLHAQRSEGIKRRNRDNTKY